ncbi:Ig-like domain-containing protein [bacterium]|nr:Ig-like domain-containing protein [bacterium]
MRQEELLQFIFLFIFIVLIAVLVGTNISRFNLADAGETVSNISVSSVAFGAENSLYAGTSVMKIWANHPFSIQLTGKNLNSQATSQIIFSNSTYSGSITKDFDCENSSNADYCSFSVDPLTFPGYWSGVIKVNGNVIKTFYFDVIQMCGVSNNQVYSFDSTINSCSGIVSSKGLLLCNYPSQLVNEAILSNNTCQWTCSYQLSPNYSKTTESCLFNVRTSNSVYPNPTLSCGASSATNLTASSTGLCSSGSVIAFEEKADGSGWTWICSLSGHEPLSCSATRIVPGKCSYLNTYTSLPTTGSCSSGKVKSFSLSGNTANWVCEGSTNDSCSVIIGECSKFEQLTTIPSSGLCISGNPTTPNTTNTGWSWSCNGKNGGKSVECSAIKKSEVLITIDASKITISPSTVKAGEVVSVKITDAAASNQDSLMLVAKPILSHLNNQASALLSKCTDNNGFCGNFVAPDSAGEWSISLYSSDNKNIPISTLKTFIIVSDLQIPVITAPVISPSVATAGENITIKLSVSGTIKGVKVELNPTSKSFSLKNSLQKGACSESKDLWCGTLKIPATSPGGNWNAKVVSYIDNIGTEKTITSDISASFVVRIPCSYNYSDWSNCVNGKKSRSVVSAYPTGCIDSEKITEASCESVSCTAYNYSDWSSCLNGKRTRKLISATPSGCLGNAILEEACTIPQVSCSEDKWECENWQPCTPEDKQIRRCFVIFDCPLVSSSSPELSKSCSYVQDSTNPITTPVSPNQPISIPTETINSSDTTIITYTKTDISLECTLEGITDVNTCQDYIAQINIADHCISNKITSFDQCKKYLLTKYPTLIKCQKLKTSECEVYINDVLLADLKNSISEESKEKLKDYTGTVAAVNAQEKTINVTNKNTGESSSIKVENIPIANDVSVNLLLTKTSDEQKHLSPVAITFDFNKNGIPDDIESRLGSNIDKDVLIGVDKAIIDGKSLEQPKLKKETLISGQLTIDQVNNKDGGIKFQGKATPNQVVTLFIYSTMPIVITVKADSNGNWIYELDKTLINGKHEAYVVINNSEGRILEASLPKPFFIDEARAVAMDEFVRIEDASSISVPESSDNFIKTYVGAGLGFIFLLIVIFFFIRIKAAEQEKQ